MKIGVINRPFIAAFITVIFAVITNLWFRLSDQLSVRGLVSPANSCEQALGWIGVILQPWIWLGYTCCRAWSIPGPHSSLAAVLITSVFSGLLLFGVHSLAARLLPRAVPFFILSLAFFAFLFAVSYASDLPRLIDYDRNPPVTGP